ncbi:aldose epimerase family protein [Sphingomonas sp. KR1UV-12]|uniref:Aldose 1-epimerase n=1 Tax=Sphingomonas aurea TaxID=3063994 RepID=A0ABT9EPI6_9SPHN|nr:aldose epimerase family protein [Sphingomonas sp. KR1UV-12]MDP1028775.1 aldose epimerase family protein [Sphingomonas sp. KR1UV-12]
MPTPRLFTLTGASGVTVRLTDYGARLTRIDAPDRDGRPARVLLGFDDPADYLVEAGQGGGAYLGATCGRVANRIAGAAFTLDGIRYPLAANEGANQRHGGPLGFDRALWELVEADATHVILSHHSPDGDQGYPGALTATAAFTLTGTELAIVYTATTTRPTHVNLVSHGYFNLSGRADGPDSIADHHLRIAADAYLPVDPAQLPGTPQPVAGTPFDFTRSRPIGEALAVDDEQLRLGRGYNHNYGLPGRGMREAAWLHHPASGRTLTVTTDQPGLQLYTGGWLPQPHTGLCLEAQAWPDACNRPDFPTTRLDPGALYRAETRLRFGVMRCTGLVPTEDGMLARPA